MLSSRIFGPTLAKWSSRSLSTARIPTVEDISVTERPNGVFEVELNRPDHRNSFTMELWKNLGVVFNELSDYSKCRSIVLHGAGKSFCAGIDLQNGITSLIEIINGDSLDVARKAREIRKIIKICQDNYTAVEKCQKPVIAALHGHCVGAGISLAGCCDVRLAVADTVFSIREVDIGIAADVGILQRLQFLTGNDSWGREIAFTARDFSGTEALQQGFVSRTFDDKPKCLEAARALAQAIAAKSPIAVQGTKLALNYARNHGVDDAIEWIATWNQSQLQSEDIFQNVQARLSRQTPTFRDV